MPFTQIFSFNNKMLSNHMLYHISTIRLNFKFDSFPDSHTFSLILIRGLPEFATFDMTFSIIFYNTILINQ